MPPPDSALPILAQLQVDETAVALLDRFLDALLEANRSFNLTAIRDRDLAWHRHLLDSLLLLPHLARHLGPQVAHGGSAPILDVGSGGGFPGLPLAIALPHQPMTLLEATGKKVTFLRGVVDELELANVEVVLGRAEDQAHQPKHRERYRLVTCRAVAPLRTLVELTLPFVQVGGSLLAMKGEQAEPELREAATAIKRLGGSDPIIEPLTRGSIAAQVVDISKRRATPRQFPRPPGRPSKSPL